MARDTLAWCHAAGPWKEPYRVNKSLDLNCIHTQPCLEQFNMDSKPPDHLIGVCIGTGVHFVVPLIKQRKELPPSDEKCAKDWHVDVIIVDMTSRFMALQRMPRTIALLESLGR